MRTFGASFAAAILGTEAIPFFTAAFRFPTGDVFVAGRRATIGGHAHTVILENIGTIGSAVGRKEPTQLDVANVDLTLVNMPMPSGQPGQLTVGQRISGLWTRTLYGVLADIYLNFELSDGSFVQEVILPGVIQSPSGGGYELATKRVSSLGEKYLNSSCLRKISPHTYPFIRQRDVNATVPIIFGLVPRSPGRALKGRFGSTPIAGTSNTGTAALSAVQVLGGAVAEDWTLTFNTPEVVESATGSSEQTFSNTASGTTGEVFAQSFQTTSDQTLTAIKLRTRRNPATAFAMGADYWIEIRSDSGGAPGALITYAKQSVHREQTTYQDRLTPLATPLDITGGTTYWLVVSQAVPVTNPIGGTQWQYDAAGAYAGGSAYKGTATDIRFTPPSRTYSWTTPLAAVDFRFALVFQSNAYNLSGTVTGADGSGDISTDFISDSGHIRITSSAWQGLPGGGDTFTWSTDLTNSIVVFSESPAATPVSTIRTVYWDDSPIGAGGNFINLTTDDTSTPTGPSYYGAWAHQFLTTAPQLIKSVTIKVGAVFAIPANCAVHCEIVRDVGGVPTGTTIGTLIDAPGQVVPPYASPAGCTFFADTPFALPPGIYWARITGVGLTGSDRFYVFFDSTNPDARPSAFIGPGESTWSLPSFATMWLQITGVTLTLNVSTDDGTGNLVARATLDVEVPDSVSITADIDGISDDTSGTYTGTPALVVSSPDGVVHWLLNRAGVADASIDLAGSFAASHLQYSGVFAFNGVVQDDVTYKALLLKLAYESCSAFDWVQLATLRFVPDTYPTPSRTFTLDDILTDSNGVPQITLTPMGVDELVNSLTANYNRIAADTQYASTLSRHAPDSVLAFGVLERQDLRNLDFVRSSAMAQAIIDARLKRQALPGWRANFTTLLPFLDVEKDDPVALDLRNANAAGEALGGWDGSQTFQAESVAIEPSIFGVGFVLRETGIPVNIVSGDGYVAPVAIVALLDQGDLTTIWDVNFSSGPVGSWGPYTSGGIVFNGIEVNDGWIIYIDGGLMKWSQTPLSGSLPWAGFPPVSIDGGGIIHVG